ncbi:MAG: magnesium-translocating P-type ATPase [Acidobacteriales bacterium 59-55]|nr:magnesium-translocating P-type ATPase [Terriglobales bacterium]OJV39510.1 MAG: magnesium-translocating P-type ATPase [Acidobacteriales bacterium 59-55]
METPTKPLDAFWDRSLLELFQLLQATPNGLTSEEANQRLRLYGPNSLDHESRFAALFSFLGLFANPLVIILVVASAISLALGEHIGGLIIIAIVMFSVLLNFLMDFQARHAVEEIQKQIAITAIVMRNGQFVDLPTADLVPGDVIQLKAGDLVPADARLLDVKDLHVRESMLTGESLPVEKTIADLSREKHGIEDANNCVFLGTAVQTGIGTAIVVRTGKRTACGEIAHRLAMRPPETEFARGTRQFGMMLTWVTLLLVLFVLMVNIIFHRPVLESFLFAVALAVGMTPEMMPMIITVTLAQGAKRMMKKRVLVKQLAAIEDFGSIDIICTDKTGTLTEGEIVLDRHVDYQGKDNENVLQLIYLNSHFEAGIKSPLDDAILKHDAPSVVGYEKMDEIPFDFNRKRLSVVVRYGDDYRLITKGEAESVFAICETVAIDGVPQPFDDNRRAEAECTLKKLSADGYRALGVAVSNVKSQNLYTVTAEHTMTLVGFAAFLDPPKEGVLSVLGALKHNGISVVVMTGDNQYVTQKVAHEVGLSVDRILIGNEVDAMDDASLAYQAENGAIFARMSPEQKNRVILALKSRGHVVGYLGDGINDAPSLHTADVGISVMNGVNVAKDAAKIILMEKDLSVVNDGVLEGRRSFANIMKYIIMGTSSNFGNMFSMAAASLFLPFLPMLPSQILLNNFLYDVSQVSIPSDNVDWAAKQRPKRWRIQFIRQFMMIIGPISSIYDFLTFGILLWLFHASANEALFHTGWFVESLATQTLVVFVIRTQANPLKSRPSRALLLSVLLVVIVAVVLPYTALGRLLRFTALPISLLGMIALLTVTYLLLVQVVKTWFYRKHALL